MIQLVALKKTPTSDTPVKPKQSREPKAKTPTKGTADKPKIERKFIPDWKLSSRPPTRQSLATLSGCYLPSAENHREGSVVLSHGVYPAVLNHRCSDPEPNTPYLIRAWLRQSESDHFKLSFEIISYDATIPPEHFDYAIIAGYLSVVRERSFTISIRPTTPKIAPFNINICGKSRFEQGSVVRVGCLLSERGLLAIASQDPREFQAKADKQSKELDLKDVEVSELTDAKIELTLKINEIPVGVKTVEKGWKQFHLDCDGRVVTITVKPKQWKKLEDAQANYPMWIASITGKMGEATEKGFILDQPAIQAFERKPKPPKDGE